MQTPWKPVKAHFSNWPLSLGSAGQGSPVPHVHSLTASHFAPLSSGLGWQSSYRDCLFSTCAHCPKHPCEGWDVPVCCRGWELLAGCWGVCWLVLLCPAGFLSGCPIRASPAPIPVLSLPLPVAQCPALGSAAVGSWLEAQGCAAGGPCSLARQRAGSPQASELCQGRHFSCRLLCCAVVLTDFWRHHSKSGCDLAFPASLCQTPWDKGAWEGPGLTCLWVQSSSRAAQLEDEYWSPLKQACKENIVYLLLYISSSSLSPH